MIRKRGSPVVMLLMMEFRKGRDVTHYHLTPSSKHDGNFKLS